MSRSIAGVSVVPVFVAQSRDLNKDPRAEPLTVINWLYEISCEALYPIPTKTV
jgi:hypothetical protein